MSDNRGVNPSTNGLWEICLSVNSLDNQLGATRVPKSISPKMCKDSSSLLNRSGLGDIPLLFHKRYLEETSLEVEETAIEAKVASPTS